MERRDRMEEKGIIHNAFYKRSTRGNTKNTLWGRTKDEDMEMFEYRENENGKIVIVEKVKERQRGDNVERIRF